MVGVVSQCLCFTGCAAALPAQLAVAAAAGACTCNARVECTGQAVMPSRHLRGPEGSPRFLNPRPSAHLSSFLSQGSCLL